MISRGCFNPPILLYLPPLMNNPCINCGKQRIDGKSWKEKIGTSLVTYTQTICPDPACQKIIDKGIADRKAKSDALAQEKIKAKLAREKLLAGSTIIH